MEWISIYDEPEPVRSENDIIYSTNPGRTQATNEKFYILKGPSVEVVVAEALGYRLAEAVGIDVPPCALCRHPRTGAVYFASEEMPIRSVELLFELGGVQNPSIIQDCFAFDVWVANVDRNIGGFVAAQLDHTGRHVRVYSIDYERCNVLRGVSGIAITALENRKLKTADHFVARRCFSGAFPAVACAAIQAFSAAGINDIFAEVATALAPASIPWMDSAAKFLHLRSQQIAVIAREVWNA